MQISTQAMLEQCVKDLKIEDYSVTSKGKDYVYVSPDAWWQIVMTPVDDGIRVRHYRIQDKHGLFLVLDEIRKKKG